MDNRGKTQFVNEDRVDDDAQRAVVADMGFEDGVTP